MRMVRTWTVRSALALLQRTYVVAVCASLRHQHDAFSCEDVSDSEIPDPDRVQKRRTPSADSLSPVNAVAEPILPAYR